MSAMLPYSLILISWKLLVSRVLGFRGLVIFIYSFIYSYFLSLILTPYPLIPMTKLYFMRQNFIFIEWSLFDCDKNMCTQSKPLPYFKLSPFINTTQILANTHLLFSTNFPLYSFTLEPDLLKYLHFSIFRVKNENKVLSGLRV